MFNTDEARKLLQAADVFFVADDDDAHREQWSQTINLNDTFEWGAADGEYIPDGELPVVAELFYRYGWCGILFWVSERRGPFTPEFADVRRFIEFVRQEEAIRKDVSDSNQRAYAKREYTIGHETF